MNFFNVGLGELLVIILLALLLFGPQDILNIMRAIGKYTREASYKWAQLSAEFRRDFLPEEAQQVVEETKASFADMNSALDEVQKTMSEMGVTLPAAAPPATSPDDAPKGP